MWMLRVIFRNRGVSQGITQRISVGIGIPWWSGQLRAGQAIERVLHELGGSFFKAGKRGPPLSGLVGEGGMGRVRSEEILCWGS